VPTPLAASPRPTRSSSRKRDPLIPQHDPDEPVTGSGGGLVRVRFDIAYDGTALRGWARQPGQRTVQGEIEAALATVLRTPVALTVAGRTDSGVHATGQVASADVPRVAWEQQRTMLVRRLRGVLPPDIAVPAVREAHPAFDARFTALARHYVYRHTDAPGGPPPLRRADTVGRPRALDERAMAAAAALLLGEHDFAAYCRRRDGATTVRALTRLDWHRDADGVLVSTVEADAFCHSMVRSLVGALLAVGEGRRPVEWPASLLTRRVREDGVAVAPAHGLTLVAVDYPPDSELAEQASRTRNRRG